MNFSPIKRNREVLIKTTPSYRYNPLESFAEWQSRARAKLAELLGFCWFTKCPSEFSVVSSEKCDGYVKYEFYMKSEANYELTLSIYAPEGVKKAPLAVCLFGHPEDLAVALDKSSDRGLVAAALARGYVALAMEQRSFGECYAIKDVTLEDAARRVTWAACYNSSMRSAMMGRTTIGERVWDIMRVIDACLENFDFIDGDNIVVLGHNGNGTAAYYAGAIDERITSVISSCGVATWESSVARANHCACNYIPNIPLYFDMGDIGGLIAPRKLVLLGASDDEWFPEYGLREAYKYIEAAYAASCKPSACKLLVGGEGRVFRAEDAWSNI